MSGSAELAETFGWIGGLFSRGRRKFLRFSAPERGMNGALQLRRSRMDGLRQRQRFVAHFEGLQSAQMSSHVAAHIPLAGMMRATTAETNLHERHAVRVILQRPRDHSLDPDRQFQAAVDVLIRVDPNLHRESA